MNLFSDNTLRPLADRIRPKTLGEFIGQTHIVGEGKFLRTMQLRNLICALYFDKQNNLWVASGWDGQFLKVSKQTGQVLGAIGNGNGTGNGAISPPETATCPMCPSKITRLKLK